MSLTPEQAIAIRGLWLTLGENGNLLAKSWGRLIGDLDPLELIKVAERLASKLPKLYADTAELIAGTGVILGGVMPTNEVLAGGPRHIGDPILDELLDWEVDGPSRSSSSSAGPAVAPTASPPPAELDGETTTSPSQPEYGAQEAPNKHSGPTTPETKVNGTWAPLAALLIDHSPELLDAMAPSALEELLIDLDELMQRARLWDEYTLEELGTRWLGQADWVAVPSYDLTAFAQRVVMQATGEVEATGLGSRAMAHRRKEATHDTAEREA